MPSEVLPERTLPVPGAVPPMMLLMAPWISTPSLLFARRRVPDASVPMKLPSTRLPAASLP
jgi:hypothetical protein